MQDSYRMRVEDNSCNGTIAEFGGSFAGGGYNFLMAKMNAVKIAYRQAAIPDFVINFFKCIYNLHLQAFLKIRQRSILRLKGNPGKKFKGLKGGVFLSQLHNLSDKLLAGWYLKTRPE
jgi:hypothetical protein